MIVIVPIALVAPAMLVFIPPAMVFPPTLFPCFVQLISFVVRLPAVASMMLDRLVQVVFRMLNAALAVLVDFLLRLSKGRRYRGGSDQRRSDSQNNIHNLAAP